MFYNLTVSHCLSLIGVVIYTVFLLYLGLRKKIGFASWYMFANLYTFEFQLRLKGANGVSARFNPWLYLPHTRLVMGRWEVICFLNYLKAVHNLRLDGFVILNTESSTSKLEIFESNVVA